MAELMRRYDPPRPVLVQHSDGAWYTGFCEGWVQSEAGLWRASVTFTTGVGETRVKVVAAERVRPVDE